jgi:hypothetical protein
VKAAEADDDGPGGRRGAHRRASPPGGVRVLLEPAIFFIASPGKQKTTGKTGVRDGILQGSAEFAQECGSLLRARQAEAAAEKKNGKKMVPSRFDGAGRRKPQPKKNEKTK